MNGLSPRAQRLFAELGEELKNQTDGCAQLIQPPAAAASNP